MQACCRINYLRGLIGRLTVELTLNSGSGIPQWHGPRRLASARLRVDKRLGTGRLCGAGGCRIMVWGKQTR